MRHPLKHAEWLTPRRIYVVGFVTLILSCFPTIFLLATSNGVYDLNGKLLGTDYSAFWSAGRLALADRAGDAYDLALQDAHLDSLFDGPSTPLTAWLHPPTFYLIATPFATLPYLISLACWIGMGLTAYISMIRRLDSRAIVVLLALAFPPVLTNVPNGQTGMLIAALFGGALLCLGKRPYLSGALIGLMTLKPHLGVLIPFALLAGGHYRSFAMAALISLSLVLISIIWLGPLIWMDFLESLNVSRGIILESGDAGWFKFQSVFVIMRIWGASIEAAYIVHGAIALGVAMMVIWTWRQPTHSYLKFAALIAGSCLVSPYLYDYDLAILAPAIGWMILYAIRHGFLSYEKSTLAFITLAPAFTRAMPDDLHIPLGLFSSVVLFGMVIRRISHDLQPVRQHQVQIETRARV